MSNFGVPLTAGSPSATRLSDGTTFYNSLTDTELRATPVPVSGTVTANLGTIAGVATETTLSALNTKVTAVNTGAVVISSSALPTGAATSALQSTGNTTLTTISGQLPTSLVGARLDINAGAWLGSTTPTVGQKTMAASLPVVVSSDQTNLPVNQTQILGSAITVGYGAVTNAERIAAQIGNTSGQADFNAGATTAQTLRTVLSTDNLPTSAVLADATANPTTSKIQNFGMLWNGTTWDRARDMTLAMDTSPTGIQSVGLTAQVDDTSVTSVTENNYGPVRMSPNRSLHTTLRNVDGTAQMPNSAVLSDATANPTLTSIQSFNMTWNGTTWDRQKTINEDVAHASGDQGNFVLGVRQDTNTVVTSAAGDYSPLTVDQFGNTKVVGDIGSGVADTATSFPLKIGAKFSSPLPTVTSGQRVDLQADSRGRIIQSPDAGNATYSASATFVAPAAATNIFNIIGSATKKVTITKIGISATATGSAIATIVFNKLSTASTGGTSTSLAKVPHDSASAAATAVVRSYTVSPTSGTVVGAIQQYKQLVSQAPIATTTVNPEFIFTFGDNGTQGIVLNGVAQELAISLSGGTFAGNSFSISIEFTES